MNDQLFSKLVMLILRNNGVLILFFNFWQIVMFMQQ